MIVHKSMYWLGIATLLGYLPLPARSDTSVPPDYEQTVSAAKHSPEKTVEFLKAGNARFVGHAEWHPHVGGARLLQAGSQNQGDFAYATVLTCSDSRVPVEEIFDAGVMDIFVVRVAGNVCDTDEIGSIEYGLSHVNTPVLVVLGHTQCGAVTAVTHAVQGHGHPLERNIPPLVDNIEPAVRRTMQLHPDLEGDAVIPAAVEENVWQSIEDLYRQSPATRELVASGKAKVLGAVYDVGTGEVKWLPEEKSHQLLAKVEAEPDKPTNALAGGGDSHGVPAHAAASAPDSPHATAAPAHAAAASASHAEPSAEDRSAVEGLFSKAKSAEPKAAAAKPVTGRQRDWIVILLPILVIVAAAVMVWLQAHTTDERGQTRTGWTLGAKLTGGFAAIVIILTGMSVYSRLGMSRVGEQIVDLAESAVPLNQVVLNMNSHQLEQNLALERVFRFGLSDAPEAKARVDEAAEHFHAVAAKVEKEIDKSAALLASAPARDAAQSAKLNELAEGIQRIDAHHGAFEMLADSAIGFVHEGQHARARLIEERLIEFEDEFDREIAQFVETLDAQTDALADAAEHEEKATARHMLAATAVSVMLGMALAVLLTRMVTRPIRRALASLTAGTAQVNDAAGQVAIAS